MSETELGRDPSGQAGGADAPEPVPVSALPGAHPSRGRIELGEPLAWYNENDPFAAQVLRELIADGEIAPGVVDERSIEDVRPDELSRFTQCHFFAGGGVWSYALRRAGWPDDRPIWTGSCPCQPFSQAGKGEGFADKRHLWPSWQWLIDQCEPECILGEQVADKGADAWLDLVQADVEGMGYAFGCVPLASAGFGAPNPRHRSFWVAHARRGDDERWGKRGEPFRAPRAIEGEAQQREWGRPAAWHCRTIGGMADPCRVGRRESGECCAEAGCDGARQCRNAHRLGDALRNGAGPVAGNGHCPEEAPLGIDRGISWPGLAAGFASATGRLAYPNGQDDGRRGIQGPGEGDSARCRATCERPEGLRASGVVADGERASSGTPGPVNGFWADADWLYCRDPGGPRWRPVNSGTFPLAPSVAGRVGALRVSGNAINAEVATGFIEAVIAHLADSSLEEAA